MTTSRNEQLLDRYLNGETTPIENAQVEAWLEESGRENSAWQQMPGSEKAARLESTYLKIQNTVGSGNAKVIRLSKRQSVIWRSLAAASILLAVCFTIYFNLPKATEMSVEQLTVSAAVGERQYLTLADGSKVWVHAGSTVQYPKAFEGKTREIYLTGEAYFDIAHDANKPFIIHTGKVVTTVLGTAFNIREDQGSHMVEVTVTRGKVSVANGNKLLGIVTPDQQIRFDVMKEEVTRETVDTKPVIAWQQSELHFEDISFEDAALQLEKSFSVKIAFGNDQLKKCRFTGTILNGQKLEEILKVLSAFNNSTYKKLGDNSILIEGPGCI